MSTTSPKLEALEARSLRSATIVSTDQGLMPTDTVTATDGTRYFTASTKATGDELWRSDGTAAGTVLVRDSTPGKASSGIFGLVPYKNGVAYFQQDDHGKTNVLWTSDGTKAGTRRVSPALKDVQSMVVLGDKLVVVTGVSYSPAKGDINDAVLWSTDGTARGTIRLRVLEDSLLSNAQTPAQRVGDRVVFSTRNAIWSTDGTTAGTVQIVSVTETGKHSPSRLDDIGQLTPDGLYLYAVSDYGVGRAKLWATDGTTENTIKLADHGPDYQYGRQFAGGRFYFVDEPTADTTDDPNLRDVWETDGTAAGTHVICQVKGIPVAFGAAGSRLVMATLADNGVQGDASHYLYSYDPTTARLTELQANENTYFQDFNAVGDTLFMVNGLNDVWQTDGTADGTRRVYASPDRYVTTSLIGNQLAVQREGEKTIHLLDPAAPQSEVAKTEATVGLVNGTLRVFGTDENDVIRFTLSDADPSRLVVNLNGVKHSFAKDAVARLNVYAYDGDDQIVFVESRGKLGFRTSVDAGAGNDRVYTGGGRDTIDGGFGNDTLDGGNNDDSLVGGNGNDSLSGSFGDDSMTGGNGADYVRGGRGNDQINGGGADDRADTLDGDAGADILFGQSVIDVFFAGKTGKPDPDDLILN